jgi:hypothetical protein
MTVEPFPEEVEKEYDRKHDSLTPRLGGIMISAEVDDGRTHTDSSDLNFVTWDLSPLCAINLNKLVVNLKL